MASRTQIEQLSRRIDAIALVLKWAAESPACPTIRLDINTANSNMPSEREQINALFERAELRRERVQFEVSFEFTADATATAVNDSSND